MILDFSGLCSYSTILSDYYWRYSVCVCLFFFFKQKTAYEMRISDWSSDVCSSDLPRRDDDAEVLGVVAEDPAVAAVAVRRLDGARVHVEEIGRASCRERVCQYV